jgi:ABC-type cobalamin/Fe3+-siderophores transport system ATPase subunit
VRLDLELKNYRPFPIDQPARFSIGHGFTAVIGPNNSGKSSLLRFFYEFRNYFQRLGNPSGNFVNALRGEDESAGLLGISDQAEVFSNLNTLGLELRLTLHHDYAGPSNTHLGPLTLPVPRTIVISVDRQSLNYSLKIDDPEAPQIVSKDLGWFESVLTQGGTPLMEFAPWHEAFRWLGQALYVGPFRNALNAGATAYYDLQIGQGFISQWNNFRSGTNKAQNVAAYRLTQDIRSIFGLQELDIVASVDDTNLQLIIDGQPYRLDEVGGGIAHFVIVLAFAATRSPSFILIDEPELNLHPALQLDFLTTVGRYAGVGTLFATHSLGLAKAAAREVYTVRRIESGRSDVRQMESTPRLAEFLGELGLSSYQELGYNRVLLAEGPTDVTALQRLLRLYGAEHEVVLVPLGGGSLISPEAEQQLAEIRRLSESIYAIVDSERASADAELPANVSGFARVCDELGIQTLVLERRALENYFTDHAVKAVKGDKYRALGPFERLKEIDPAWGKAENWRIAAEMTEEELQGTDLGTFLGRVARGE